MLKIRLGQSSDAYCDGVSRRSFLRLGALSLGAVAANFSLADLLRAEEAAGIGSSNKAIINIHLGGGPSHQDIFDLKPEAAVEFRGEFSPISTNVEGIQICEHLPKLAQMADKFAIIRSLVGSTGQHSNYQTHSGYDMRDLRNAGGRPSLGSVISKVAGPSASGAPAFISYNGGDPGYLGPVYKAYAPQGGSLKLTKDLTVERLDDRTNLLASLDRIRRDVDSSGQMEALDSFTQRAVGVVTSGKVAEALDASKVTPDEKERYGKEGMPFLTARRLVESGVRVVTFSWGGWDTHSNNFTSLKRQLPNMDRALSALLTDLHDRGLEKDVTVVVWGEFGRTPRVNGGAGRDHWPQVMGAFLAGGGMKTGQVIGSTTKNAEAAKDRPVHFHEVFSTLYYNLGIDVGSKTLEDTAGRPQYLVDKREVIRELV
ncbi:protein of unknown function DUF1501 [Pirellula staleyi DSM 6068]|uniref:DUF1501 domain-containing protein n=1 Tax=Pirellula staleyi (strain ATCC 27377 / DSM 6068 / ICPB 4128) TaxID=530564 RepID=D2R6H0_PIRSD|nr:DUF1501 domain-containing protein [Pirellula staleyi]ADB15548.1 protein of unknown function DUF1501 [Pirellula staleyi DSM 6068]